MSYSKIEWMGEKGRNWPVVTGCTACSPECDRCWAAVMTHRLGHHPHEKVRRENAGLTTNEGDGVRWNGHIALNDHLLREPLRWPHGTFAFVAPRGDLFHSRVSESYLRQVFHAMKVAPHVTFFVLTKRAERMEEFLRAKVCAEGAALPNVWVGVTVGCHESLWRLDALEETPAVVRVVSAEPLLEPIRLVRACGCVREWHGKKERIPPYRLMFKARASTAGVVRSAYRECDCCQGTGWVSRDYLDWVIVGAESGPGARPMQEEWVRSLRDDAQACKATFFYKQHVIDGKKVRLPALDGKVWADRPKLK